MPELQTILTYRGEELWPQNAGEGNPLGCADGIRGPSPYDEGGFLPPRPREARLLNRNQDREGAPTGTSIVSRPGGRAYTDL